MTTIGCVLFKPRLLFEWCVEVISSSTVKQAPRHTTQQKYYLVAVRSVNFSSLLYVSIRSHRLSFFLLARLVIDDSNDLSMVSRHFY